MTFKEWAIQQHREVNHRYHEYLPYEFHLEMVVEIATKFKHVLPTINMPPSIFDDEKRCQLIEDACWGHDLIEDTRITYNDVDNKGGKYLADIIYALTNEKGKNRKERANEIYYKGIRSIPGAIFVKLCDRIANVKFGLLIKGRMIETYRKENASFISKLGIGGERCPYVPMIKYLEYLFSLQHQL